MAGAPEGGLDAGGELVGGEGFDHIVVEAGLQALDYVVLTLAGCEHDDGKPRHGRVFVLAQPPHKLKPVYTGHVAVGDEEVGDLAVLQEIQRLLAVFGLFDLIAETVELRDHDPAHDPVIVYDQYARALEVQKGTPSRRSIGVSL